MTINFDNNFSFLSDFWNTNFYYNKVKCYKKIISKIKSLKCKYVLKQYPVFKQFCNKFTYNFIRLMLLYSAYSVLTLYKC